VSDDAVLIEFAYTGEKAARVLWAYMTGGTEAVRSAALSLLLDIQDYDERAAVWIGGKLFTPTKEELANYQHRVAEILKREKEKRASGEYEREEQDAAALEAETQSMVAEIVEEDDLPPMPSHRF